MTASADMICRSGVSYPVAIEIARQLNAGSGGVTAASVNQLVASGMVPQAATVLVAQITAASFNSAKLSDAGMHAEAAITIKKQSGL